jgi:hypothetical protein
MTKKWEVGKNNKMIWVDIADFIPERTKVCLLVGI